MQHVTTGADAEPEAGRDPEGPSRPWSRADKLALGALLVPLGMTLIWLVHPWYTPYLDASIYISTARAMIAGEGYSFLGVPCQVRPPGFPFLLTPLIATLGVNFHAMNLYVASFGCGVVILLFCWARPRLGWFLSLLVCITVGTNPVFRRLCSQILSDMPGMFFVLVALLFARRCERRPSVGKDLLLGTLVGLSAYVRMIDLMLLPAILLHRFVQRVRRPQEGPGWTQFALQRCAPVAVATILAFAPWAIRSRREPAHQPVDQLANHSYATAMFHVDHGDPDSPLVSPREWGLRVRERGGQITGALATRLVSSKPTPARVAIGATVLVVYLYWLIASPSVAGFFVLLCLGVTGSYFAYVVRLLLPVYVLLVPALTEAVQRLLRARLGSRWATGLVAASLIALTVSDFAPRRWWRTMGARHEHLAFISEALERELPPGARLATGRGFHYGVFMDRPVYSLRWSERLGPGITGIDGVIDRHELDTLFLDPKDFLDQQLAGPIVERYGEGELIGGVRVFRVRE